MLRRWLELMRGIRIKFEDAGQQKLKLTFDFLLAIATGFITAILLWAVAIGVVAGRMTAGSILGEIVALEFGTQFIIKLAFGAFNIGATALANGLGAAGAAIMVGAGAGLVGGVLGFLFGLPRRLEGPAPSPAELQAAAAAGRRNGWDASPNLNQIADWLTKIIIGVGLVEAQQIIAWFGTLSARISREAFVYVSDSNKLLDNGTLLSQPMLGATTVVPAVIVCGLAIGFIFGYLLTALFLAEQMANAGDAIGQARQEGRAQAEAELGGKVTTAIAQKQEAEQAADAAKAAQAAAAEAAARAEEQAERVKRRAELVQGWRGLDLRSLFRTPETANHPPIDEALRGFAAEPLDALRLPDELRAWAKAQLALGQREVAAAAYLRIIAGLDADPRPLPILQEAYELLAALHAPEAPALRDRIAALEAKADETGSVAPIVKNRVRLADVNQALYRPAPEGFTAALQMLDELDPSARTDGAYHVYRAAALGQSYLQATRQGRPATELAPLREAALVAVREGVRLGQQVWLRYLLDGGPGGRAAASAGAEVDDDLAVFQDDPEFRSLLIPGSPEPARSA